MSITNLSLPHRPPILMLREITECGPESASGIASIPKACPFLNGLALPRSFFVELLSQLIAAAQGHRSDNIEQPAGGYLVGIHDFQCFGDARSGDSLELFIRKTNQVKGLLISEGRVLRGNEVLASGEIR